MTAGLSAANLANIWLGFLRGTTITSPGAIFVKLHTGDPGASGTANAAVGSTTRPALTFGAPSAGVVAMTGTAPTWTNGGTSETITHISIWDSATAGNFLDSIALTSSKAWASGDTLTMATTSITLGTLAA